MGCCTKGLTTVGRHHLAEVCATKDILQIWGWWKVSASNGAAQRVKSEQKWSLFGRFAAGLSSH